MEIWIDWRRIDYLDAISLVLDDPAPLNIESLPQGVFKLHAMLSVPLDFTPADLDAALGQNFLLKHAVEDLGLRSYDLLEKLSFGLRNPRGSKNGCSRCLS